jgi:hypothetical protein
VIHVSVNEVATGWHPAWVKRHVAASVHDAWTHSGGMDCSQRGAIGRFSGGNADFLFFFELRRDLDLFNNIESITMRAVGSHGNNVRITLLNRGTGWKSNLPPSMAS